jgi:hypothetical protein
VAYQKEATPQNPLPASPEDLVGVSFWDRDRGKAPEAGPPDRDPGPDQKAKTTSGQNEIFYQGTASRADHVNDGRGQRHSNLGFKENVKADHARIIAGKLPQ